MQLNTEIAAEPHRMAPLARQTNAVYQRQICITLPDKVEQMGSWLPCPQI